MMTELSGATGEGYATVSRNGVVLDAWYPEARLVAAGGRAATTRFYPSDREGYARTDEVRRVEIVPIRTDIASLQDAPVDVHDAYLRLHLLSLRRVRPNTINLDNIFQLIPTVAWTTMGPCALDDLDDSRIRARIKGVALDGDRPEARPRDVRQHAEDAVEVDLMRAHEAVREQVQAQVRVRDVGGCGVEVDLATDHVDADAARVVDAGDGRQFVLR